MVKNSTLREALDRRTLRQLAGAQSFQRGEDYFGNGQVRAVTVNADSLNAKVQGGDLYGVRLWINRGEVDYVCTCPMGRDGEFCKHCVAAGLALLDGSPQTQPTSRAVACDRSVTMKDVREYLSGQDASVLVDLLVRHAEENDALRRRLTLAAAKRSRRGIDVSVYRQMIDAAVDTGDFVEYGAARDFAQGIDEILDSLDELLREGDAADVIELTEYGLAAVESAVESVDDSDGYMGGLLDRLQHLHLQACVKARPDPEALANRLFAWELRASGDVFSGAADSYAKALGKPGIAVYRQLAEAEWAKVPVLGPGRGQLKYDGNRYRITKIMEALARQTGKVEAMVAIRKRDLSSGYSYLQIAEMYVAARKRDLALEWAERGLTMFPKRTDPRLREFLAGEYHRRRLHGKAMELMWTAFVEWPALEQFRLLKAHADRGGRWKTWREKAIAFLRESIAPIKRDDRKDRSSWSRPADRSELVRILLWERKVDAAWREAVEGGCSNELWMALANKRKNEHPDEALPVYRRQIDPLLNHKNNQAYRSAVGLLREIRELMIRVGSEADFMRYLASVRASHKAKRNFIELLDHARWT